MNPEDEKDVTQSDVSEDPKEEAPLPEVTERERISTELFQKRAEALGVTEDVEEEGEVIEEGDPETPEELPVEVPTIVLKDAEGKEIVVPADAQVLIKVDGQETNEPIDTVLRGYQKGVAADQKFDEAAQIRKKAETYVQDAQKKLAEQAKEQPKVKQPSLDFKALAEKLNVALVDDDSEKVAEVFAELHQTQTPQPLLSQDDIVAQTKKEVRWQLRIEDANEKFAKNYPELQEDAFLYDRVGVLCDKYYNEMPDAKPWEIVEKSAEEVKEWLKKFSPKEEPPDPKPDLKKREEKKKRTVAKQPTSVSGRSKVGEDPKPPPTRQEIINQYREQRNQPPL